MIASGASAAMGILLGGMICGAIISLLMIYFGVLMHRSIAFKNRKGLLSTWTFLLTSLIITGFISLFLAGTKPWSAIPSIEGSLFCAGLVSITSLGLGILISGILLRLYWLASPQR